MGYNECVETILSELSERGIKGRVEHRGKHLAVCFTAGGRSFQYFTASTPSDVRAVHNDRADIRRMLRSIGGEPAPDAEFRPTLSLMDGEAFVNSREVADAFGKEHRNVLRDIDNLLKNNDCSILSTPPFREMMVPDGSGIARRTFDMSRAGFVLLAMGFTGRKAFQFKCAYIEAFDAMERALHRSAGAVEAAEALRKLAHLQGEVDALTDIVLSLPSPAPAVEPEATKRRAKPFVRPSVMRQLRRALS